MSEASANSEYEITFLPCLPSQLRVDDYFMAVDDKGREFEGVIVGVPWKLKDTGAVQLWNIHYSPTPGLSTSGVADSRTVKFGTVRKRI